MTNAIVIHNPTESDLDAYRAHKARRIQNPEHYTVVHAVKAAQARKAKHTRPAPFNGIRGLDKLGR